MKKVLCSFILVMLTGSVLVGCGGKKEAAPATNTAKPAATQEVKAKPEYKTVEGLAYTALYEVLKKPAMKMRLKRPNNRSATPSANGFAFMSALPR